MKKLMLIFFALAVFAPISIRAQSAAANKDWPAFWNKFKSAVVRKDKDAILGLAIDDARFERDAGGDSREDWAERIVGRQEHKYFLSVIKSGFTPWNGGKIPGKSCLWFKYVSNRWYWAGTPCD